MGRAQKAGDHPVTGAAQIVEIRETVREIEVPVYVTREVQSPPARRLFERVPNEQLLAYGVPEEWIDDVLAATEDSLLELAEHIPQEAAEALLTLATGGTPAPAPVAATAADPFAHPDATRRFRVMDNVEELQRALEFPWDKWSVFLHPSQREIVDRDFAGPARVAGTAGTGKTVVALHRAAALARANPKAQVLLTTFSITLARMLRQKLRLLRGQAARSRRYRCSGSG